MALKTAERIEPRSIRAAYQLSRERISRLLDFRFAGRSEDSRWNTPGDPTLYLAGDRGVVIAEYGRYYEEERTVLLQHQTRERALSDAGRC